MSAAVLALNFRRLYLGADLSGPISSETITLMMFQVLAKVHEIFLVASLGMIIHHVLRYELLYGEGLPLGLVGSGVSFGSFLFFFTKEFWGSLRYVRLPGGRARKLSFIFLLLLAGLTATFAGPASATLLVPQSQSIPHGRTEIFLDGAPHDLWPEDLSGDLSELGKFCTSQTSSVTAICPGGGYPSLYEFWGRMTYSTFHDGNVPKFSKRLSGSRFFWPVHSPTIPIPPLYSLGDVREREEAKFSTFLVQPHAATATYLQRLATDWWAAVTAKEGTAEDRFDDRKLEASARAAIVSMRCAAPQNLSVSDNVVRFPRINGRVAYAEPLNLTLDDINSTSSDLLRFRWVELPNQFGTVSLGALFESPWDLESNSRVAIGCSGQAGWVPAQIISDAYTFWTGWYPWGIAFGQRTPAWTATPKGAEQPPTNGRIAFGTPWLDLLTPPVASNLERPGWKPNAMESILDKAGFGNVVPSNSPSSMADQWALEDMLGTGRTVFLESIIASVLVDGVSRSGSHRVFENNGTHVLPALAGYEQLADFDKLVQAGKSALRQPNKPVADYTTLVAQMETSGYAMRLDLAGYLAMAVLLTHLLMAAVHTIWVLYFGHTSKSWDTVAELVALSQNSRPALVALANTGGGIRCRKTYEQMAVVRVCQEGDGSTDERVELLFDAGKQEDTLTETKEDSTGMALRTPSTWPRHGEGGMLNIGNHQPHGRSSSTERLLFQSNGGRDGIYSRVRPGYLYG
ncbi:hypothetical protein B0A52_09308 [Exophiala mesophila]|uniref:Uncharacterized protein n=1 Tax=Exophiala mesophila TaxID=212818 RepID=A0A438MU54_EXOME|nr:hypothetical protein B0A52_09308 [Exophiala mesophila]